MVSSSLLYSNENLAKHNFKAEFHSKIRDSFPAIVEVLKNNNSDIQINGIELLAKLSEKGMNLSDERNIADRALKAAFQSQIQNAIPAIIELLDDSNSDIRISAVEILGELSAKSADCLDQIEM